MNSDRKVGKFIDFLCFCFYLGICARGQEIVCTVCYQFYAGKLRTRQQVIALKRVKESKIRNNGHEMNGRYLQNQQFYQKAGPGQLLM
jgi:hypothetical protein